jgi:hypothetical protein
MYLSIRSAAKPDEKNWVIEEERWGTGKIAILV